MQHNGKNRTKQSKMEKKQKKEKRCYFYYKVNAAALLQCSFKVNKLKQSFQKDIHQKLCKIMQK